MSPELIAVRDELKAWLLDRAFPLWWERGADLAGGGFHDRLAPDGAPIPGVKRCRVQARQAWCYMAADELGWQGPWRAAARHGLDVLGARFRRDDGLYRAAVGEAGDAVDLYDQAFVLLALAGARGLGDGAAAGEARGLIGRLPRAPDGGFVEFDGAALLANPNMHLFEAFLAWAEAAGDPLWRAAAAGQAALATSRLIDAGQGAISEVFGPGWRAPAAPRERRVEPGHQFEWAWLLMKWSRMADDPAARGAALRLIGIGETLGVDPAQGVAINALDGALAPADTGARLWPQTERLRALIAAARVTGRDAYWDAALDAAAGLRLYLHTPTPGLWRDSPEGAPEPALASSFYHIVGAILELDRAVP